MPKMMMDLFQYMPYVLVAAAMLFLFAGGLIFTIRFFRKGNKRIAG